MTPVPLQEWAIEHIKSLADDEARDTHWLGGWGTQILFVRDELASLVGSDLYYQQTRELVDVISTHRSKSRTLPVYRISRPDIGLTLYLRCNFYNWKLSVVSDRELHVNLTGLCTTLPPREPEYTGNDLSPCYFEGFPPEFIFGDYGTSDKKRWSAQLPEQKSIWMTVFLIMQAIGAMKPVVYNTQAEHRAQRAAEEVFNREWDAAHPV